MKSENTNIYVVYRNDAKPFVKERLDYIKKDNPNIVFFNFCDIEERNWKKRANRKMKECSFALFFYDNHTIGSEKDIKNVKYELKKLNKYKRRLITIYSSSEEELQAISNAIKNDNVDEICAKQQLNIRKDMVELLFGKDFSDQNYNSDAFRPVDLAKGKNKVLEYSEWSVDSSLSTDAIINDKSLREEYYDLLMKQYELMIQTSENLIQRRSQMSDKYRAVCIAMLSLVASTLVFGNILLTSAFTLIAGVLFIFISRFWTGALLEFSKNNEGKYAVINAIEKKLPANMFDTEYVYNKFKGIRTYSERELSFPRLFLILGILLLVATAALIGFAIWHYNAYHTFYLYELFKAKD